MNRPNKPYIAGTAVIATGTTDYTLLAHIFATAVSTAGVDNWYDLLVGVQSTFIFTFDKPITVKWGYPGTTLNSVTTGNAMIWANPTPTALIRAYESTQSRDNSTLTILEAYISNASGSDVTISVEIYSNDNAPFSR